MTATRDAALLVAMLTLAAAGPDTAAPDATRTVVYYRVGRWEAFSGTAENGHSFCGMKTSPQQDGRGLMVRHRTGETQLILRARKPGWSIPNGTAVSVTMTFGTDQPWTFNGSGHEDVVEWSIPQEGMADFDSRFRLVSVLWIGFPGGNEAPWSVSLAGSNVIGQTFNRCMRDLANRAAPTQPFGGNAAPAAPTQPFAQPAQASPPPAAPASPQSPAPTPAPSSAPTPAPTPAR